MLHLICDSEYECVVCMCRIQRTTCGSQFLLFHSVGPRDQSPVVRLGGKHFCLLNHLPSPFPYHILNLRFVSLQVGYIS